MSLDLSTDLIDVSEITDRVDELRETLQDAFEANEEGHNFDTVEEYRAAVRLDASPAHAHPLHLDEEELTNLESILDDIRGNGGDHQWEGDWYPQTLIARSAFVEHIKELIHDCYEVKESSDWPYCHMTMNYEAAADAAEVDYTEVTVNGSDYLYR